ncbi:RYamide receptor-like [Babylonia areolata]|uniref:RYamide receptor-like n=1 Tax=Babylonia areolata TaxID=304850 RepID=UPI003FD2093D
MLLQPLTTTTTSGQDTTTNMAASAAAAAAKAAIITSLQNNTTTTTTTLFNTTTTTTNTSVTNSTDEPPMDVPDIHPAFENLIIVLYVLVIVVALLGNGCVIYLVLSQRQMRNVTNYFIASLATSDALMALVCIPITFISNVLVDSWPFAAWMCPFATYLQVVVVFQNAFTFVAISLERYVAIMYPFRRRLSRWHCYLIIALTWLMSFGTPLPTAIVSRLHVVGTDDPNVTSTFCLEVWPLEGQRFSYSITIMVLQYFFPLVVLTYTYIRIVIVVWLKDSPPHGRMGGVPTRPVFLPPPPLLLHSSSNSSSLGIVVVVTCLPVLLTLAGRGLRRGMAAAAAVVVVMVGSLWILAKGSSR